MSSPIAGRRLWWSLIPLASLYAGFFFLPVAVLATTSLFTDTTFSGMGLDQYRRFGNDGYSSFVLVDTIRLGLSVTLLALILGYAVAYAYISVSRTWKALIILMVITPLLTSTVVRAFAWIVILGRQGVINQSLLAIGLIDAPIRLLHTEIGLIVALCQIEMPLMVLPLITALSKIDDQIIEASKVLGAGPARTFFRILLPLSVPGAITGSILVFAASASAFVSQSLIGGGRLVYMPTHVYEQAVGLQNWPFAAVVALVLMISVLCVIAVFLLIGRRVLRYAHVG